MAAHGHATSGHADGRLSYNQAGTWLLRRAPSTRARAATARSRADDNPLTLSLRNKLVRVKIVLMAAEGLHNHEIASRLSTRREIVSKWRKRFFTERLGGLEERPRRGRPDVFSP